MAFAGAGDYELLEPLAGEPEETVLSRYCAHLEDLFWSVNYWKESYFRPDYDYEDYAPAYCVGYSGRAQYGGRFDEAETSLCANFVRIKGDSRLTWNEARDAIRAAWQRVDVAAGHGLAWSVSQLPGRVTQQAHVA